MCVYAACVMNFGGHFWLFYNDFHPKEIFGCLCKYNNSYLLWLSEFFLCLKSPLLSSIIKIVTSLFILRMFMALSIWDEL